MCTPSKHLEPRPALLARRLAGNDRRNKARCPGTWASLSHFMESFPKQHHVLAVTVTGGHQVSRSVGAPAPFSSRADNASHCTDAAADTREAQGTGLRLCYGKVWSEPCEGCFAPNHCPAHFPQFTSFLAFPGSTSSGLLEPACGSRTP